ncbi:polygalacturonase inhibitor 1-like [Oryza sativa Japonica Group]|jgi:Leucine-rich repeat (LRR) protein|uniref:Leucine-rich repeat-containing N-terminal plant-type domain-containing protein n=6 Tax=Oryza TaxID=4527 RepID=A0A8J8YF78_ORYSJ|nr:polygalacturonase inhibitor 1-like [Oryza sativa Japonica Group]XP_052168574.1 polygalacturonase inhibitor 1-like [Oryza glaberrima]KAB8111106.1 hypothetical protein EE612_048662 [Oryza sativa]EEE69955.1 hypothetical protein OsJ_29841 [Oryza sativa Japonica Group]KAF2916812.1 hypothetical protein DAI22_09g147700 [Oryza sativa Japonica Group]BAT08736.1 Os09g0491612 [Oryza sativa Japonica Group]
MANATVVASSWIPLLCLVVVVLSACTAVSSAVECNGDDRAALLRVKAQLGDPVRLSSWRPSTNCCAWEPAVFCSGEPGRVTGLALFSLAGVAAPVPPALGELTGLAVLQIASVRGMSGPIPPSFANLSLLEDLDITGTSISGPVPASYLAGATNLRTLVIADSRLAGPIPPSLAGDHPNLRYLDLSGNFLTGAIPPGLVHGSFRFLILSHNQLTGEIPRCYGDVDTVDLSHNRLTGDPSPHLFGIAAPAAKIDLSWNELAFDMTGVRFPHHLRYLDLSHNRITGKVAKSLMDVRLEHLNVSDNELCGEIPAGRFMAAHGADCYARNRCLCGAPLPPCCDGGL